MKKRKVQVVIFGMNPKTHKISKVLLLLTNKKRGSFWQNVTGSAEKGERYPTAALRELWEETGITVDDIHTFVDLKLSHTFVSKKGYPVTEKSYVVVVDEQKITFDKKEHQDYKWSAIKTVRSSNYKFETNFESFCLAKKCFKF